MKYYIHKKTGEPLALLSGTMIDVHHPEKAKNYPHLGERKDCISLCIFPERWIGNGIRFHAISYSELNFFKRISKEKFAEICPDFGQFRHKNDMSMDNYQIENIPIRKKTFGV